MVYAAVRHKAVDMLLLIHCLLLLPLFIGVCLWSLFSCAVCSVLSSFAIMRADCFTCLLDVMWLSVFCVKSSRHCGLVCRMWLRHFLVIMSDSFLRVINRFMNNDLNY